MRLSLHHSTTYRFETAPRSGLQQIRLSPQNHAGQNVVDWSIAVTGGAVQTHYIDHHQNAVSLVSFDPGITQFVIECHGTVDTEDQAGVIGKHTGAAPLWYFRQDTGLTTPGPLIRRMVKSLPDPTDGPVAQLHTLSQAILAKVPYRIGATQSDTPAEAACAIGAGVCQDHAHIFITAARMMGYAARYVSGYLFMADQLHQAASHAWAEIHIDKLGWVGFDISNGISPDDRYIRVATGLDYRDAAPIVGVRMGQGGEDIDVSLQIRAL